MYAIVLDAGTTNTVFYAVDIDNLESFRSNVTLIDVLPVKYPNGIPSAFFYSDAAAARCRENHTTPPPWVGFAATGARATPMSNRIYNIKRHLGEPLAVESWNGGYDEAYRLMVENAIRTANENMMLKSLPATNQVIVCHPSGYNTAQKLHLVGLVQKCTLSDGTAVQVAAIIDEASAAGMAYAQAHDRFKTDCVIGVADIGGGTTDISLTALYPAGRTDTANRRYFSEVLASDSLYRPSGTGPQHLGGCDFDSITVDILRGKLPAGARVSEHEIRNAAIEVKHLLSDEDEAMVFLTEPISVTRREFEEALAPLLNTLRSQLQAFLKQYAGPAPDHFVITGGTSFIPCVKRAVEEAVRQTYPRFSGSIDGFQPLTAVALGAAHFATAPARLLRKAQFDLGVQLLGRLRRPFIDTHITADTPLPVEGSWRSSYTSRNNQTSSEFLVYEAKTAHPDPYKIERDYRRVGQVTLSYPAAKKDTEHRTRLVLGHNGLLKVTALDPQTGEEETVEITVDTYR